MSSIFDTKINNAKIEIDARATRSVDGKIKIGVFELQFKGKSISMKLGNSYRDINKNEIAEIEKMIHKHIGCVVSTDKLNEIASEIYPIVSKLSTNV